MIFCNVVTPITHPSKWWLTGGIHTPMSKVSSRKVGATALAVSMLTGVTVANAANIVPKTPTPANTCVKSVYQPDLGCPDWADEFDGTEVNKDFWTVYSGYSEAKQDPYGKYTDKAATVSDGQLHLTTKVGQNGQKGDSAEMTTNNKAAFEDGYWEYKLSYTGYGHVGGYLYGNGNVAGPQKGEIDGFEAFGATDYSTRSEGGKREKFNQTNRNQTIIHYSADAINAQTGKKSSHSKGSWHTNKPAGEPVVVGILKTADGVKIFRDGVLVEEMKASDPNYAKTFPAGEPLNVTLTARVSNVYWGQQSNPTGGISVDYVRHYPLVTAAPEPTPEPTSTPTENAPTPEPAPELATPAPAPTASTPVAPVPTPSVDVTPAPTTETPKPEPSSPVTPDPKPSEEVPTATPEPSESASPKPSESPATPEPSVPAPSATVTPTAVPSTPAVETPTANPSVEPTITPSSDSSATPNTPTADAPQTPDTKPLAPSSDSVKKVEARTGHDSESNGWIMAGIATIVALFAGFAGWFFWVKPRRDEKKNAEE